MKLKLNLPVFEGKIIVFKDNLDNSTKQPPLLAKSKVKKINAHIIKPFISTRETEFRN